LEIFGALSSQGWIFNRALHGRKLKTLRGSNSDPLVALLSVVSTLIDLCHNCPNREFFLDSDPALHSRVS
jgi:hypothetical protein